MAIEVRKGFLDGRKREFNPVMGLSVTNEERHLP